MENHNSEKNAPQSGVALALSSHDHFGNESRFQENGRGFYILILQNQETAHAENSSEDIEAKTKRGGFFWIQFSTLRHCCFVGHLRKMFLPRVIFARPNHE